MTIRLTSDVHEVMDTVLECLLEVCPHATHEELTEFAVRIALVELRAQAGDPVPDTMRRRLEDN